MRLQHGDLALARVGRLARQAVVEHTAEGVDVGAPVERVAADLLGAAVVDRAEKRARVRHVPRARALGETEVAQVRVPAGLGEQDVRGLEVSMDQRFRVRGVERAADLLGNSQCVSPGQRVALADQALQARAVHVAHREVEDAIDLVRVVDRDHVRVVERRGELGLAQEPGAKAGIVGVRGRDHLQRNAPFEPRVPREEDGSHAALPENGLDRVRAELVADVHGHVRSR